MATNPRLISKSTEIETALLDSMEWCDSFEFCAPSVDAHHPDRGRSDWPVFIALEQHRNKLKRALVSLDSMKTEPDALLVLHGFLDALRLIPAADGSFRVGAFIFSKEDQRRVFSGLGALAPEGLVAPLSAVTYWEGGELEPFALQMHRVFDQAASFAFVPEKQDLIFYMELFNAVRPELEGSAFVGAKLIQHSTFDTDRLALEQVTGEREIADAVKVLREQFDLSSHTRLSKGQRVGYQGGNGGKRDIAFIPALGIWSDFADLDGRYWNSYGVEYPDGTKSLSISVELNPPSSGVNRRVAGAIARDKNSKRLFLLHSGRIGGGREGIGPERFWSKFRSNVLLDDGHNDGPRPMLVVGEIGAPSFLRDLASFVHAVARLKEQD